MLSFSSSRKRERERAHGAPGLQQERGEKRLYPAHWEGEGGALIASSSISAAMRQADAACPKAAWEK